MVKYNLPGQITHPASMVELLSFFDIRLILILVDSKLVIFGGINLDGFMPPIINILELGKKIKCGKN